MKKINKWLLVVALLLVAFQGISCRGLPRAGVSQDETPRLTVAFKQEKSLKPEHITVDEVPPLKEPNNDIYRRSEGSSVLPVDEVPSLKEPNNDIHRRSEGSSVLPNTGKPTGFSQISPNENGMPRGVPVPTQTVEESTRLSHSTQNVEEPKEFQEQLPAGNRGTKVLSAPTKLSVKEYISWTKMNSKVQEDVAISHEGTSATKPDMYNDLQSRGTYHHADMSRGKADDDDNDQMQRFLHRIPGLGSESTYTSTPDLAPTLEDETMQNRFLAGARESDKTEEDKETRPMNNQEIPSDDIVVPPTTSSVRFSQRGRFKVRRKRRSSKEDDEEVRRSSKYRMIDYSKADGCSNEMAKTTYIIMAVTGWLVAITISFTCCVKLGWICRGSSEDDECQLKSHSEDLESGQEDQTLGNQKETSMYEKYDRRPTGFCHVESIDELTTEPVKENEGLTRNAPLVDANTVSITVVDVQKDVTNTVTSLVPLAPSMPTTSITSKSNEDSEVSTKKVRFEDDTVYNRKYSQRRASEKVKVVRKLSSSIRKPSLLDEIEIAKEVIMDDRWDSKQDQERRRVIKEATANERRGSLLEEIQFAKTVIVPSADDKERNEDAFHRRHLIRLRSSSIRTSLLDNITMATEVLTGGIETAV